MFFDDDSIKSQVPKTLLRINPGYMRVLDNHLKFIDRTCLRSMRAFDSRKRKFFTNSEYKIRYIHDNELEEFDESLETAVRLESAASPTICRSNSFYFGGADESLEGSRRSSLKSTSIIELEPPKNDSPTPTEEHLSEIEDTHKSQSSKVMPEVVVTRPSLRSLLSNISIKEDSKEPIDEEEPSKKLNILTSFLPPPTSTRFIGKMHASLHRSVDDISRKSYISSEMIKEDIDETLRIQDKKSGQESTSISRSVSRTSSNRRGIWKKVGPNSFDQGVGRKKIPVSPGSKFRRRPLTNKQSPFTSGTSTPSHISDPEELLTKIMNLIEYLNLVHSANTKSDLGDNATLKNIECLINSSTQTNINTEKSISSIGGGKVSMSDLILKGMPTSSRFVGKLQSRRLARSGTLKSQDTDESDEEAPKTNRHPGLPTSFRYIGKSISAISNINRGPNNLVIETPPPGEKPDFSHTANMLSIFGQATKEKESTNLESDTEATKLFPSVLRHRVSSRASGSKLTVDSSSKTGSLNNDFKDQEDKISMDEIKKLEKEEGIKAMFDNLSRVRVCSIPNWNLHRHVKEDKKRLPYFMQVHQELSTDEELQELSSKLCGDLHL
ncbi:unnamed protein product [Lepeophtheirus salmonis]|uniref:(salmon louse) hypothetical protein n=1 Tax=Lepeophtheirus salmonis TaxID=72036 RepID=A0A7R8H2P5_LEPSM|nr:unnamed protein product [Lepeophtheirus salmonis]CAF2829781.1 unnamed protein product [Lepeophtheirus salmonis]